MTDEQFNKFIETIVKTQETREMLIRIDENTKNSHLAFERHLVDDTAHHTKQEISLRALHTRVDWMLVSGILAIVFFALSLFYKH